MKDINQKFTAFLMFDGKTTDYNMLNLDYYGPAVKTVVINANPNQQVSLADSFSERTELMRTSASTSKQRHAIWRAAGRTLAITMVTALLGCSGTGAPDDYTPVVKSGGIVRYVIESDAPTADSVSVELKTQNGTDSREEADIALPYTLELLVDYSKPFNFKSAEISATASASASFITCRIFYDDKQMTESTAEGNAPTVACQSDEWPRAVRFHGK
ncbi:hypothetical protein [Sporosarcina limicola]|uniref:Uncharacterized protein n=1 Tax=Sporosarcina limicola TaxID=34101 RepID=A0A927MP83_9BACL|nr:hypothetical protein [Sporosarcina limicola]MBE1556747.1 hypothetical protein [Sporosarcina limicola]